MQLNWLHVCRMAIGHLLADAAGGAVGLLLGGRRQHVCVALGLAQYKHGTLLRANPQWSPLPG